MQLLEIICFSVESLSAQSIRKRSEDSTQEWHGLPGSSSLNTYGEEILGSKPTSHGELHPSTMGYMVEEYLDIPDEWKDRNIHHRYDSALSNWSALLKSFTGDLESHRNFIRCLSMAQANSTRLLFEFWEGNIDYSSSSIFEDFKRSAVDGRLIGYAKQATDAPNNTG